MKHRRIAIVLAVAALALAAVFGKTFIEFIEELETMASEIATVKERADADVNAAGTAQALALSQVGRYVDEIEEQMQKDADNQSQFQTEYESNYAEIDNAISEVESDIVAAGFEPFSESDYSTIEEALASSINPVPTPPEGLVKIKDIYDKYRVFKDGNGVWHVGEVTMGCDGHCEANVCYEHMTDEFAIKQLTIMAKHVAIARKMGIIFSSDITNSTIPQ